MKSTWKRESQAFWCVCDAQCLVNDVVVWLARHSGFLSGRAFFRYYFSIQFVIYLVGAAAISLFFVIVFDIGWVVARFMIARVTFVQENACRSCQRVFDISKLPRKCALCTFYYCRKCTFQTRIIPGCVRAMMVMLVFS